MNLEGLKPFDRFQAIKNINIILILFENLETNVVEKTEA